MDPIIESLLCSSTDYSSSSSSSESNSFSSDEFEEHVFNELLIHQAVVREKKHYVSDFAEVTINTYTDKEFICHFRLSRAVTKDLINRFKNSVIYKNLSDVHGLEKISAEKHIYTYLWFVGHQCSSYRDVADRFHISLSTLHSVITRVSNYLISLPLINWPTAEEAEHTKTFFFERFNFPGIVGIIDGTHIKINRPKNDPDSYINRKQFYSIQVQLVCNENRKVIDAFIGYPGSVHDVRIYRNSPLSSMTLDNFYGGYLIGDSAYPCRNTLIVPYRDNGHLTHRQKRFNQRLSSCRITIEHTNGLLKQRFRQLYHLNLKSVTRACKIIKSCVILHNMANEKDLEGIDDITLFQEDDNVLQEDNINYNGNGAALRDEITDNL